MGKRIVCLECMSDIPVGSAVCPVCHHSFKNTNPPAALPVGTLLADKYTLDAFIGVDGEGMTYNAVDNSAHQLVTIKEYAPTNLAKGRAASGYVLPANDKEVLYKTTRMDFADMYNQLITLAGTKGLQTVYEVVEANNTVYAVLEPQNSISLEAYLARSAKPLTQQEAIRLLMPIVNGVSAMHNIGLLHRGISTTSIYVQRDGTAWLGGYATLGLREAGSEMHCELFDGYAAPEQYSVADFDGKYTDVYALGAVFYRALTGVTPVSAQVRMQADSIIPIKRLLPALPNYAAAAVSGAMRLGTSSRIKTADEFMSSFMSPAVMEKQAKESAAVALNQKKIIMAAVGIVLVFAVIGVIALVRLSGSIKPAESDSVSETTSVSESISVSSVAETLTMPNLLGLKYTDIVAKYENQAPYFMLFTTENAYSDIFNEGEIMEQSVAANTEIGKNQLVHLVISLGEKTAVLPEVVYHSLEEVKSTLDNLGIKYTVVSVENDGSYMEGYVVRCDKSTGTEMHTSDEVVLYVAKAAVLPPEPASSSVPQTPSSSIPAEQPA